MSRVLADGYRAELVRAARSGLAFAPATGEPEAWAAPAPEPVTWYRHAVAYAEMKWPHLAPHSRASLADALSTVTPLLTWETGSTPPTGTLRAALYGHAFNPPRRSGAPDPGTADALAWLERASLPVSRLSDPRVIRTALDGLCTRLDGSPAAANTITRKRAVFHGALGYAVELGLLSAIPARGRGRGTITLTAACPRTGAAWTGTGTPFEPRGLKHRPDGTIRVVPIPPILADMLCQHLHAFGTAPDGRLFRGARGGMLSESVYGRAWHAARQAALGPGLAATRPRAVDAHSPAQSARMQARRGGCLPAVRTRRGRGG